MPKASRQTVKTLTLVKNRDIVVDRLFNPCEEGDHARCTGWAVLRKEVSPIDANYFLRCTCTCHHKREQKRIKKKQPQQIRMKRIKRKAMRNLKPVKKSKKSMRKRRR